MAMNRTIHDGLIKKRVLIDASSAHVFLALTDAKELTQWFCDGASSDPREGGELEASWITGEKGRAVFTRIVPEELVELLWMDDGSGVDEREPRHALSYRIHTTHRVRCEVIMQDVDYPPPDEETLLVVDNGWNSVLLDLKDHCERKERSLKKKGEGTHHV